MKWLAASAAGLALAGQASAFTAPATPLAVRATTLRGSTAGAGASAAPSSSSAYGCAAVAAAVGISAVAAGRTAKRSTNSSRRLVPVTACKAVKAGDSLPDADLDCDFGPPNNKFGLKEYCKGKKVVLVGLPGAFTPTWSSTQVPGYLAKEAELKAKGVDAVLIYCVNDYMVMKGWAADQGVEDGGLVRFLADPRREFTEAVGMVLDHPGPVYCLGAPRCKRFSMLIEDGVIKTVNVAEGPDDPAGDDNPTVTLVENMLTQL